MPGSRIGLGVPVITAKNTPFDVEVALGSLTKPCVGRNHRQRRHRDAHVLEPLELFEIRVRVGPGVRQQHRRGQHHRRRQRIAGGVHSTVVGTLISVSGS